MTIADFRRTLKRLKQIREDLEETASVFLIPSIDAKAPDYKLTEKEREVWQECYTELLGIQIELVHMTLKLTEGRIVSKVDIKKVRTLPALEDKKEPQSYQASSEKVRATKGGKITGVEIKTLGGDQERISPQIPPREEGNDVP